MVAATNAAVTEPELGGSEPDLAGLRPALGRLDSLLERAVAAVQAEYGQDVAAARFRGLYISQNDVERLLAREPGAPALQAPEPDPEESVPDSPGEAAPLAWLAQAFGLSPFDVD